MRKVDLTGRTFGRLTAISYHGSDKWGAAFWLCHCTCGGVKITAARHLKRGYTRSCGCLSKDFPNRATHNDQDSKEYEAWVGIKKRCLNPRTKNYNNYGGRGIKICDRWINSYENFLQDVGRSPSNKHSIERRDNNGNYNPINVIGLPV
jgi:hypothetical protein